MSRSTIHTFFLFEVPATTFPFSKNIRAQTVPPNPRMPLFPLVRPPNLVRGRWFRTMRLRIQAHVVSNDYQSPGISRLTQYVLRGYTSRFPHVSRNHSVSLSRIFCFCASILRFLVSLSLTCFNHQETALINSGTKVHRANARERSGSRRSKAKASIRPRDVHFPWLKDIYSCGEDNHLDGCPCEVTLCV